MREASYYTREESGVVHCQLCPHHCRITPGNTGICRVRENREGTLYSLVYGWLSAAHLDPIEKKPLFHFLPGSSAFSVATVGCNFSCPFCQNHTLSQDCRKQKKINGYAISPEKVVEQALETGCRSLCFTYSEPTIFFEYMLEMARIAKARELKTNMVSNGFIEKEPFEELAPFMDGANIDLKAFREETYRKILGGALQPVLDTIALAKSLGTWVEVTTLVIPAMNDSDQELRDIAGFIAGLDKEIPWHVSRFYPTYKWTHLPPTPVESLRRAAEIGRAEGLKYVYTGNVPHEKNENTFCPGCGNTLIERYGFAVVRNRLTPGAACPDCGRKIAGVFES